MSTWCLFFEWKRFPEVFKEDPLEKEKGETEWKRADEKEKVQMIFERHQSPVSSFRPHALESTCVVTKRTQLRDQ